MLWETMSIRSFPSTFWGALCLFVHTVRAGQRASEPHANGIVTAQCHGAKWIFKSHAEQDCFDCDRHLTINDSWTNTTEPNSYHQNSKFESHEFGNSNVCEMWDRRNRKKWASAFVFSSYLLLINSRDRFYEYKKIIRA